MMQSDNIQDDLLEVLRARYQKRYDVMVFHGIAQISLTYRDPLEHGAVHIIVNDGACRVQSRYRDMDYVEHVEICHPDFLEHVDHLVDRLFGLWDDLNAKARAYRES